MASDPDLQASGMLTCTGGTGTRSWQDDGSCMTCREKVLNDCIQQVLSNGVSGFEGSRPASLL